ARAAAGPACCRRPRPRAAHPTGGAGARGMGGACRAGAPACVPGGGPAASDCLVETVVQGGAGVPVVTCTDGDPTCDVDPAPGRCGFALAWCFGMSDPRLRCSASGVSRVTVHASAARPTAARTMTTGVLAAIGDLGPV